MAIPPVQDVVLDMVLGQDTRAGRGVYTWTRRDI